jgi:hypothetical protein
MAFACKLCIAKHGLKGSDVDSLPQTQEELNAHIEAVHHIVVRREGETAEAAIERFTKQHPEAARCAECIEFEAPWTK